MKKIKQILLLVFGSLTIVSCGGNSSSSSESATQTSTSQSSSSEMSSSEIEPTLQTYTVTWKDENAKLLGTTKVEKNKVPSYTYSPITDETTTRVFIGWALTYNGEVVTLSPVNEDTTYFAIVSATPREYKITFDTGAGSNVDPITAVYGTEVNAPTSPTLAGSHFVGWARDVNGTNKVNWPVTITGNVTFYAIYNESIDLKSYFSSLISGYKLNPYQYIPESMLPDYSANVVRESDLVFDYTSFVNVNKINSGFGEQWNMILSNLDQSMLFFNAISAVDSVVASSVTIFNNFIDSNPNDFSEFEYTESSSYRVIIIFKNDVLTYVVNYELLGVATEIALSLNIVTGERVGRIQMGDANALRYVISEDSYTFAIRYLGIRRAYFHIKKTGEQLSGHIYETLGVEGKFTNVSAAQFFVLGDYVAVVGNKASGIIGFSSSIAELYNKKQGKLLGYEIEEKLSAVTYNTLWFNLSAVTGINNIKIAKNDKDVNEVFLNNQTTVFATKLFGGFNLKTASRRYDIETRNQYVSIFDETKETYVMKEVEPPMIFIQEEKLNDFAADVKEKNSYLTNFALTLPSKDIDNIKEHYTTLVPLFKEFKELITAEDILDYIGSSIFA